MLSLERIHPWMLLRDSLCATLLRILAVGPPVEGSITVVGWDQLGELCENNAFAQ